MKVEVITWYGYYEDEEVSDMGGDYWGVDVKIDGKLVKEYGDYYHDKGSEQAIGFVAGLRYALGEDLEVKFIDEPRLV